jgi:hypothetical protein
MADRGYGRRIELARPGLRLAAGADFVLDDGAGGRLEAIPTRVGPGEDDARTRRQRCSGIGPVLGEPRLERGDDPLEVCRRSSRFRTRLCARH